MNFGRLPYRSGSPDFLHDGEGLRVEVFEFGGDEGVEVVAVEVGLGGFGEVFLVVGGGVVTDGTTGEELHLLKNSFFHGGVVGFDDLPIVEAQDLVVVGVRQFMKDDGRVLEHLFTREKGGGVCDVDLLGEAGIIAAPREPSGTGVILHSGEFGVFVLEPNFHRLHLVELLFGQENTDALKVVGEHLDGFLSRLGILSSFKQGGVDVHGPPFDVLLHGLNPADFFGARVFLLIAKGKPDG